MIAFAAAKQLNTLLPHFLHDLLCSKCSQAVPVDTSFQVPTPPATFTASDVDDVVPLVALPPRPHPVFDCSCGPVTGSLPGDAAAWQLPVLLDLL